MEYEYLEEAGQLEIEFIGSKIDAYSLGVLNVNLQDIIDKVSFWILSQEGIIEPTWKRPKYLPLKSFPAYKRFIKAEVSKASSNSFYETITFCVASVWSDPTTRSILNSLAANIIYAIGISGVKGIKRIKKDKSTIDPNIPPLKRPDPFDIGPNIKDVVIAIAEFNQGKDITIKIKSIVNEQIDEINININT